MIHGFNLNSKLVCEGIIGDGCGGGRIFYIKDGILKAYDKFTNTEITLLKDINNPISISKKGCIIFIECEKESIRFDLSALRKV